MKSLVLALSISTSLAAFAWPPAPGPGPGVLPFGKKQMAIRPARSIGNLNRDSFRAEHRGQHSSHAPGAIDQMEFDGVELLGLHR